MSSRKQLIYQPVLTIIFCICLIFIPIVRELLMEKIVIIGSAGAGKTTLARKLGYQLHIKVVHLDRLFWKRVWKRETKDNWKGKTKDTRIDILDKLVREKQWIIEGTYLSSSEPRLNAADTIIFLDIAPLVCLLRIIRRHHKYRMCSRRDIPEGCTDKLTLLRMWRVIVFPLREGRELKKKLRNFQFYEAKQIIWLHSTKEVEDLFSSF